MSIRIRLRAKKKRAALTASTPSLKRFRAARADEAELRVERLRAKTIGLEDGVEMVTRRFGVVRGTLRAVPERFVGVFDAHQLRALREEVERALLPLNQDPLHVLQEAIL